MATGQGGFVSITLSPSPDAPGIARRFVGDVVPPRTAAHDTEVLELLVSEMVTDAVHRRSPWLNVGIEPGRPVTRVEVVDTASPQEAFGRATAERFGARLLDGLADRWGIDACAQGRRMWFEVRPRA